MAYDIAGNLRTAQPVTSYYKGRALRQAEAESRTDVHYKRALAAESRARTAAMGAVDVKKRLDTAGAAMSLLRDTEARILTGYQAKIEAGEDEAKARAWAQEQFVSGRGMASKLGVYEILGMDPQEDADLEWDPEAAVGAITTADEAIKAINKKREAADEEQAAIAEEQRGEKADVRKESRAEARARAKEERDNAEFERRERLKSGLDIEEEAAKGTTAGADLTKAQRGKLRQDLDAVNLALDSYPDIEKSIGLAVGIGSNVRAGTAAVAGQTVDAPIAPETIDARTKLANFNEQVIQPLIKSQAKGIKEQERLMQRVMVQPGEWLTNEDQAQIKLKNLKTWLDEIKSNAKEQLGESDLPEGVPPGSKKVGTAGGQDVYEAPDGTRYRVK